MEYTDKTNNQLDNKHFSIIMLIFALFITILFVTIGIYVKNCLQQVKEAINNIDISDIYVPVSKQETDISETEQILYEVKEYNGKIGVFENGSLIYTLDTYVFTLPNEDKKFLSEGIKTSDKEELLTILEEYY